MVLKTKKLKPTGHRVMVLVDKVEEVSKGGIIVSASGITDREQFAAVKGTLVDVGPTAWNDSTYSVPWAEIGDRVMFAKNAGYMVTIGDEHYRIINDEDITSIVLEEEEA